MASIEITIANQKYVIRGEDSEEHLREVAELVRRKVEGLRKKSPATTLQKAAILAAFDFASESINGRKKALEYRNQVVAKTSEILQKVETELTDQK